MNNPTFDILPWIFPILLGLGLAASSGLRAFLPLLMLALAARFQVFELNQTFAWLGSPLALGALGVATVVEVAGDKIPIVDHFLDSLGTLIRPLAATLAAAAVMNTNDPATAALMGLVVGAPLALGVHATKAGTRGVSSATTLGIANPILSFFEDIAALLVGALSLLAPLLVPLLLVCFGIVAWKFYSLAKRVRAHKTGGSTA